MARRVFFSFHHGRDVGRVGQIRNSWVVRSPIETVGFVDAAEWESIKRKGDIAVKNWIDSQLKGTSVTIVLVGAETHKRRWVKYEIEESHKKGNGIFAIKIHNVMDFRTKLTDIAGENPLDHITASNITKLSDLYPTYDWILDNGRENIGRWIDLAKKRADEKRSLYTKF